MRRRRAQLMMGIRTKPLRIERRVEMTRKVNNEKKEKRARGTMKKKQR